MGITLLSLIHSVCRTLKVRFGEPAIADAAVVDAEPVGVLAGRRDRGAQPEHVGDFIRADVDCRDGTQMRALRVSAVVH
jgi:hypothetical protein